MFEKEYRFKFYLNARHTMNIKDTNSKIHPHTWEIVLFVKKEDMDFVRFNKIENNIQVHLAKYEGFLLNTIPPFDTIMPTMENIGEVMYEQINISLKGSGWFLIRLEISENPTRTYIVSNGRQMLEREDANTVLPDRKAVDESNPGIPAQLVKKPSDRSEKSGDDLHETTGSEAKADEVQTNTCETEGADRIDRTLIYLERIAAAENTAAAALQLASIASGMEDLEEIVEAAEMVAIKAAYIASIERIAVSDTVQAVVSGAEQTAASASPDTGQAAIPGTGQTEAASKAGWTEQDTNAGQTAAAVYDTEQVAAAGSVEGDGDPVKPESKKTASLAKTVTVEVFIIAVASVFLVLWITRKGMYPQGTNIWGHLFRSHLLYENISSGVYFPLYTDLWLEGVQPFRHWPPLPYYMLALFEYLTNGNTVFAYNIFIGFAFAAGASGWMIWGVKAGRSKFGLVLGILWFFLPANLRATFFDGDVQWIMVMTMIPYLLMFCRDYTGNKNMKSFLGAALCMFFAVLSNMTVSVMVTVALVIYLLWYGIKTDSTGRAFEITAGLVSGWLLSGIWLYPALKGIVISSSPEAVVEAIKHLTHPVTELLNPLAVNSGNKEVFYFGISIFVISLFGLIFGGKKEKAGFGCTILFFVLMTQILSALIVKVPMSQFLPAWDFMPAAMCIFFASLMMWKDLKKQILVVLILLIAADCGLTFKTLGCHEGESYIVNELNPVIDITAGKIAVLEIDSFSSYPGYYIPYNSRRAEIKQVFGWDWKGIELSRDIVWIHSAIENGWYSFLFDRCLELGADTLLVRKDIIKDMSDFMKKAAETGYEKIMETKLGMILKLPVKAAFGTVTRYEGLGIGKYSSNMAYVFPRFEVGESDYIEDYSLEKLKKYKVVYLSGFKIRDRAKAENMVKTLSKKGVRFIVDLTNIDVDIYSSRASFLEVIAEPLELLDRYPVLKIDNKNIVLNKIPREYYGWRTIYLENLDSVYGKAEFQQQEMNFLGTKYNDNVVFIGFNIPYFAMLTKDDNAIGILERITGMKAYRPPEREIVKMSISNDGKILRIKSDREGVSTGIASLDSFDTVSGSYEKVHGLIVAKDRELVLKVGYRYFIEGLTTSFMGLTGIVAFYFIFKKRRPVNENMKSIVNVRVGDNL